MCDDIARRKKQCRMWNPLHAKSMSIVRRGASMDIVYRFVGSQVRSFGPMMNRSHRVGIRINRSRVAGRQETESDLNPHRKVFFQRTTGDVE